MAALMSLNALAIDAMLPALQDIGSSLGVVRRQKHYPDGEMTRLRKLDALFLGNRGKKLLRHGHEQAGAVASVQVTATATTMVELAADLESTLHDIV